MIALYASASRSTCSTRSVPAALMRSITSGDNRSVWLRLPSSFGGRPRFDRLGWLVMSGAHIVSQVAGQHLLGAARVGPARHARRPRSDKDNPAALRAGMMDDMPALVAHRGTLIGRLECDKLVEGRVKIGEQVAVQIIDVDLGHHSSPPLLRRGARPAFAADGLLLQHKLARHNMFFATAKNNREIAP